MQHKIQLHFIMLDDILRYKIKNFILEPRNRSKLKNKKQKTFPLDKYDKYA